MFLAPLGLDRTSFISQQTSLSPNVANQLTAKMLNYSLPLIETIITGVDTYGAHIYLIDNDHIRCLDSIGFAAAGIGARHAESQLMLAGYGKDASTLEAVLLTHTAKKRSEVAPGVGRETDMFVITGLGNYSRLNEELFKKLEEGYKRLKKREVQALKIAKTKINSYLKKPNKGAAAASQEVPKDTTKGSPSNSPKT